MKGKRVIARLLRSHRLRCQIGRLNRWSGVLVLNYHRIGNGDALPFDRGLWSANAESFLEQIRFCKSELEIISPDNLEDVRSKCQGRFAIITFDDGYRDNYEVAFPILRTERVPATFFVTTGFIDVPRLPWWDEVSWMVRTSQRDHVNLPGWLPASIPFDEPAREGAVRKLLRTYKALPTSKVEVYLDAIADATGAGRCETGVGRDLWMTWNMLREMRGSGMTVGGHTVNHPVLARASLGGQRDEIVGCAARIGEEMGQPMRYFAYPVGGPQSFDANTVDCLREVGVRYAFSYYGGVARFGHWHDYNVHRVPVETDLSSDWFRSMVVLPQLFA